MYREEYNVETQIGSRGGFWMCIVHLSWVEFRSGSEEKRRRDLCVFKKASREEGIDTR